MKKFGHFATSVCTSFYDNSPYQFTFNNNRQQQPFRPPQLHSNYSAPLFSQSPYRFSTRNQQSAPDHTISTSSVAATNQIAPILTPASCVMALMARHSAQIDQNASNSFSTFEFNPLPDTVNTPININNLAEALTNYPNRNLANYLINGFKNGFDIGYSGNIVSSLPQNLLSAHNNSAAVTAAINKELSRKHTSGPFRDPPFSCLHCSNPKKDGTHRIILDLSSPKNCSINSAIDHDEFLVKYSSFDDAVDLVRFLGLNCEMGKIDIKVLPPVLIILVYK